MVLVDCHNCRVLTPDGKKSLGGRVVHTKDSVKIYFNVLVMRDARVRAKVIFYDDRQGVLSADCELLIRRNPSYPKNPEPWMADCTILELRRDEQNLRRSVRIKTNLEVEFRSANHGGFYGTIKDLSVGGMQLATRQILDRNERITFTYSFGGPARTYEAVALRAVRSMDGKFIYGCRFVRLSDQAESAIGGYVFKKQQEQRRAQQTGR